jgi:hypothetical protein
MPMIWVPGLGRLTASWYQHEQQQRDHQGLGRVDVGH